MAIDVQRSTGRRAMAEFVRFPFSLYANCDIWVPPLVADELRSLDPRKNPVFGFTDAAYWVARRDGEIVGRVAGFVNHRDNERRGRKIARFGMIDFVDDAEVCGALLEAVETWTRESGMEEMEGPAGHFDRNCVLVEGFAELPTAVSSYNFPYYGGHIEAGGYTKAIDYLEHRIAIAAGPDARIGRIAERVLRKKGLRLWESSSKRELMRRGRELFDLINEAYSGLHDFVPLTDEEIDFLIGQFFRYIDRRYVKIVDDAEGKMAAVGVGMESFSEALQAARGRLFPLGWWRMMRAMKRNEVLDLYLVAVRPDQRGAGLNAILMHEMHKTAHARGMNWAETNGELESNEAVQAMWKGYDVRTHKRRRIYSKPL